MFKVIFYERENGEIPVETFLSELNVKMRVKIVGLMEILQEKGNLLREPYSKHVEDGIFEIRAKAGSDISRVLYFFYHDGKIIMTNGFVKKTQKTPRNELEKAKRYRNDYIKRYEDEKL